MKKTVYRHLFRLWTMPAVLLMSVLALTALGRKTVYAEEIKESVTEEEQQGENTDLRFVFVHGLSGWGSYDDRYKLMPYWGMFGGDLIRYLNEQGYPSYAASVDPEGSAWDRACELYAQLTGSVVDYGKEHSERCGHERFGRDFSKEPLIQDWDEDTRIVLLGHSFGGATVRLFSEILANGWAAEQEATEQDGLSPYFAGGQGWRIHALVTLAAPTNGTTAYDMTIDRSFDRDAVELEAGEDAIARVFEMQHRDESDGKAACDTAAFDMYIDNALALNKKISTLPGTYYFAIPCSATEQAADGTWQPVRPKMESLFRKTSTLMGSYTGVTPGGFVIDETWMENDGLVNTVSAKAPIGAPSADYDQDETLEPGIWYVMPTYDGDHMSLQGGMTKKNDVRPFYLELLEMISELPFN